MSMSRTCVPRPTVEGSRRVSRYQRGPGPALLRDGPALGLMQRSVPASRAPAWRLQPNRPCQTEHFVCGSSLPFSHGSSARRNNGWKVSLRCDASCSADVRQNVTIRASRSFQFVVDRFCRSLQFGGDLSAVQGCRAASEARYRVIRLHVLAQLGDAFLRVVDSELFRRRITR